MLRIVILALAVCMASACKELRWATFKNTYNKTYKGDEEHYGRGFLNYNLRKIDEHNKLYKKGHKSYFLKENKMLDMEYRSMQYLNKYGFRLNKTVFPENDDFSLCKGFLNPSVDWRKDGYVSRVKDQGACGSSWAFSATGAIEGQLFKQTGKLVELSESNLVDCSSNWGNQGCKNGSMDQAFQYVIDNKGINTDSSYPYVDKEGPCKFNSSDVGAKVKSVKEVESGSEDSLMAAVATVGPVSAAIDARGLGFTFYGGGVYDEPDCSYTELNHAVLVVGYGTQDGKDYWIVKNSWGEDYGLDGYILMSRNKENQCGIATAASYPVM